MADLIIKPTSGNLLIKDDQDATRMTVATSTGATTLTNQVFPAGGPAHPCFSQMFLAADDSSGSGIYSGFTTMNVGGYASPNEAITESSGTFSFTETGYFKFTFRATFALSSADSNVHLIQIKYTANNSSYTQITFSGNGVDNSAGYVSDSQTLFTRITDIANQKLQVHREGVGGVGTAKGGNAPVYTWVSAEKIATN